MNLDYKLIGEGKETVLFLHGWGANKNSFLFCEHDLSEHYKILKVDFCGFGNSEKLKYPLSVFDYSLEIFKLLKKLNITQVNIVCHSFGARVAVLLCSIFNLNVKKLVIIGGAGLKPKFNIITKLKILAFKIKKILNKLKLAKFNLINCGSSDYITLNHVEKQTFKNVINFDEKSYLKCLTQQTLLIWGNKDKSTPLYMGKKFNRLIKKSKLIIIKNCGHFCFLENPEIVKFEVLNFLLF